jgi:hypothetical protein
MRINVDRPRHPRRCLAQCQARAGRGHRAARQRRDIPRAALWHATRTPRRMPSLDLLATLVSDRPAIRLAASRGVVRFANREHAATLQSPHMAAHLKPQDVMLALKLVALGRGNWTQPGVARALHLSAGEVNHGLKRLAACHLYVPAERRVVRASLQELLVSGIRYVFPATLGLIGDGMPTAFSVGPLAQQLRLGDEDRVVWLAPGATATVRGRVIDPLYPSAPLAAAEDPKLHELLALADTLRVGRARERALARTALEKRLAA